MKFNLEAFLPKVKIPKAVFEAVYDALIKGREPDMARIYGGHLWAKIGERYLIIDEPVDWLMGRCADIPNVAKKSAKRLA